MKKHGFTLAEVLITLSIIGVVAALTMPALTQHVGGAKIGPSLAKFVSTFENAIQTMMIEENVGSLMELTASKNEREGQKVTKKEGETYCTDFLETLSKYMIMSPVTTTCTGGFRGAEIMQDIGLDLYPDSEIAASDVFVLKDGTAVAFKTFDSYKYGSKDSYKGVQAAMFVNIAGLPSYYNSVKSRPGKEVFVFLLDDSGVLIPYGGKAFQRISGERAKSCSPESTNATSQYSCTGAFADAKWQAPPNY